jgi:hypothetical protein
VGATLVVSVLAGAFGAWLGPEVLHVVFGASLQLDAAQTALVAVGCTVAVANLVLTVSDLAQDRSTGVAGSWVSALLAGAVAFLALLAGPPLQGTVLAFLTAELAAFLALLGVGLRHRARG